MLEFLEWIVLRPRTYGDVMEAWRSTCPRLSIWEDAIEAGLIEIERGPLASKCAVSITARGRALLHSSEAKD
jgi:hypothetical protein